MLPDPLHPAVVHLPIALSVLIPLLTAGIALAIRQGWLERRTWALVVIANLLLVGLVLLARETGEDTADRVEKVVDKRYIGEHAEAAEWLLWASMGSVVVAGAGLVGRGGAARAAAVVASLVVLAIAVRVGALGGELVYKHGAANAYVPRDVAPHP
ncbi:MAG TPA: DUF2231 domain-containing protein [Myxococcota bacterium]|nr:DUF2231 domain-containing protein [Myxococcota bacterium]